jgi:hypothetical protein
LDAALDHAQAALAAARSAGLSVDRAEVVAVAANVLVRLEPGAIAARLTGATEGFRDSAHFLGREARLAAVTAGDAALAGRALRACHNALLGVDPAPFEPLGMLREARRLAPPEVLPAVELAQSGRLCGQEPHKSPL